MAAESIAFLRQRIADAGLASVVLTGGSSPKKLYERWAGEHAGAIDWRNVHFFWGDERDVPHDHEDSNTQTTRPLLDHIDADPAKEHKWRTDRSHVEALEEMARAMTVARCAAPSGQFDLVLLGVGPDGHVASLFPENKPWQDLDSPLAPATRHIPDSPKPPSSRYTFTLPALNRARLTYLMPFGESKREAVKGILDGDAGLTASHVRADELLLWTDIGDL